MKRKLLYVLTVSVMSLSVFEMTAQTQYLNQYYYGFESKNDASNTGWWFKLTDWVSPHGYTGFAAAGDFTNFTPKEGSSCLKIAYDDYVKFPTEQDRNQTGKGNTQQNQSSSTIAPISIPAGTHLVSIWIYKKGDTPTKFKTQFKSPWKSLTWDISAEPNDQWVEIKRYVTFATTTNTYMVIKVESTDLPATGAGTLYLDSITVNEVIQEGEFDPTYYDFEGEGNGWYPQANSGAGYYFFNNEKVSNGITSMKLHVPAGDAGVPNDLKVQSVAGDGNFLNLPARKYVLSMNIWIDPNSSITQINTNFQNSGVNAIGDWNPITWDLTGLAKGQWNRLGKELDLSQYDDDKFVFSVKKANIDNSINDVTVYIDDIRLVKNWDYNDGGVWTNIKNNNTHETAIYPNPATSYLNIDAKDKGNITIFNLAGKQVLTKQFNTSDQRISLEGLPTGMYLVKLVTNGKTSTEKLQIK